MASTVEKISIALPPEMVASVRKAVDAGEYSSSSEVARGVARLESQTELQQNGIEELRNVWAAARAKNGPYVPADEVMDRLERKYQAIADAAGAMG